MGNTAYLKELQSTTGELIAEAFRCLAQTLGITFKGCGGKKPSKEVCPHEQRCRPNCQRREDNAAVTFFAPGSWFSCLETYKPPPQSGCLILGEQCVCQPAQLPSDFPPARAHSQLKLPHLKPLNLARDQSHIMQMQKQHLSPAFNRVWMVL